MAGSISAGVLLCAFEEAVLTREEKLFMQRYSPAGFTLFKRNIPSSFISLKNSIEALQKIQGSGLPLLVAIDQEGGRVSRLHAPFPDMGPMQKVVEKHGLEVLENYGFCVGSCLASLGINLNFSPVVDLLTNGHYPYSLLHG